MVSKDFGWIGNLKGEKKDIVVEFPDKLDRSILIGLGIVEAGLIVLHPKSIIKFIIGNIIVDAGLCLIIHETFYRGAHQFDKAETEAHIALGNLEGPIEDFIF